LRIGAGSERLLEFVDQRCRHGCGAAVRKQPAWSQTVKKRLRPRNERTAGGRRPEVND
jgi:hypothetical protein